MRSRLFTDRAELQRLEETPRPETDWPEQDDLGDVQQLEASLLQTFAADDEE